MTRNDADALLRLAHTNEDAPSAGELERDWHQDGACMGMAPWVCRHGKGGGGW